ncbi:Os11g0626933 [Oryza sativa Japonica Group]|uniref:Os11g0626933 protein n=1 Tax=Oryza sativa subsp. japonica TaxID=39947 RepID=A0A0P0Y4L4_ORYSJ|nr:Os11g0626933 [Oryza sativa Japonica Group]
MAPIILGQHSLSLEWRQRRLLSSPRGSKDNSCSTFPMAAPPPPPWNGGNGCSPTTPTRHPPPLLLGGGAYSPSLEWRQRQPVQGLALALIPSPSWYASFTGLQPPMLPMSHLEGRWPTTPRARRHTHVAKKESKGNA